jgi:hypothetical protein
VSSPTPQPPEVSTRGPISIASSRGIGSASGTSDISHITIEMTISGTGGGDAITYFELEESLEDDVECDTIGDPQASYTSPHDLRQNPRVAVAEQPLGE